MLRSGSLRLAAWLRSPVRATWFPAGAGTVGAVYLLVMSAAFARGPIVAPDEPVLGAAAGVIANLVTQRFADEVARIEVTLAAAAVLAGAALGTIAAMLLTLQSRIQDRPPRSRAGNAAALFLVVVGLHWFFLAWAMSRHPQGYAPTFYDAGGVRRAFQILVTDRLGPGILVTLAIAGAACFLFGAPRVWPTSVPRTLRWFQRHLVPTVGVLCVALLLLLASLVAPGGGRRSGSGRMNVVILAGDGIRADRLRPALTPHLSALAAQGTRFDRAYVTVPRTFSSWTTTLTGRHAHHHGIRSTFEPWETRAKFFDALPDRFVAAGYRTAVVSDFAGDVFGRIPLGFEDVRVPRNDFRQILQNRGFARAPMLLPFLDTPLGRRAFPGINANDSLTDPERVADDANHAIRGFGATPFLLTVFFSTTHFPYAAPSPFYRRFTDPAYSGPFKYGKSGALSNTQSAAETDVRQIRALYDGAVASVDAAAGSILDELRRDHLDDRTIVVVTSDHGENLYEPRLGYGHGEHLFGDEETHVPLVVFDPRQKAPHDEAAVVSNVDIAPTLYDLAAVPPPADLDGRSLARAVEGAPIESAPAFAETELWVSDPFLPEVLRLPTPPAVRQLAIDEQHGDDIVVRPDVADLTLVARHRMVRDDRWKLVYAPTRAGVVYLLFDLENDPAERTDVLAREPAQAERLKGVLWHWMLQDPRMTEERGYLVPKRPAL